MFVGGKEKKQKNMYVALFVISCPSPMFLMLMVLLNFCWGMAFVLYTHIPPNFIDDSEEEKSVSKM